jgi:hypothetical protein
MSYSDDENNFETGFYEEDEFAVPKAFEDYIIDVDVDEEENKNYEEPKVNEEEDEKKFGDERNVFERVGMGEDYSFLREEDEKKTTRGRFIDKLIAISLSINNSDSDIRISPSDIKTMVGKLDKIQKKVEFLNISAYILGYISIKSKKVSKDTINSINTKIIDRNKLEDTTVKQEDIIRYARYWLINLL